MSKSVLKSNFTVNYIYQIRPHWSQKFNTELGSSDNTLFLIRYEMFGLWNPFMVRAGMVLPLKFEEVPLRLGATKISKRNNAPKQSVT